MRGLFVITLMVAMLIVGTVVQDRVDAQTSGNPLVGAWSIVETTVTTSSGSTTESNPQPGFYMFTERHFSNMLIPFGARSNFSATRTDEERLRAYDNFIADAGTYEVDGSVITVDNIIAKVPNAMPPRVTDGLTYRFRFDGESLVLILTGGWAPRDGEITYRLERLE